MFKTRARELTIEQQHLWQESPYAKFLRHCDMQELLDSQVPFYFAVEAFPRLLLKLASLITEADARYLVVENIWEEHGQGDSEKFHSRSFERHLGSLGFDGSFTKNPFVSDWLTSLFDIECTKTLFHTLAGVEYIYAVISDSVAETLARLPLQSPAEHYIKHSALDWTHGDELLLSMSLCEIEFDEQLFIKAQQDFITLFAQLSLITQQELQEHVAKQPISFAYSREATNVIDHVVNAALSNQLEVLCVCSGGENPIHYASNPKVSAISSFDMNRSQLEVCQAKLLDKFDDATMGRFEYLFNRVRQFFTQPDGTNTLIGDYRRKPELLAWAIKNTFADHALITLFTEQAVKYSTLSFSEYFTQVYFTMCEQVIKGAPHINTENVLFNTPLVTQNCARSTEPTKIDLLHMTAEQAIKQGQFDIIDLSNIGDWMDRCSFTSLISDAIDALKPNGQLVLRRLLGDYRLTELNHHEVTLLSDDTGFYNETAVITK